jgi:SAM-dependent methyltransferase
MEPLGGGSRNPFEIFNRHSFKIHREKSDPVNASFLLEHICMSLKERLSIIRSSFHKSLILGCHQGVATSYLDLSSPFILQTELSTILAKKAFKRIPIPTVIADEENLPFLPQSYDLVISPLNLHWVNDLPKALIQIRHVLKPDGLFLGAFLGGSTLQELREALLKTEIELNLGVRPHISPFVRLEDAVALVQRAGFALPVIDKETLKVTYKDLNSLFKDLKNMGETNSLSLKESSLGARSLWTHLPHFYPRTNENVYEVTFDIFYITGWAPSMSQPVPLKPGSARCSLKDVL